MKTYKLLRVLIVLATFIFIGCPNPSNYQDSAINISTILGLTVPVLGSIPVATITETEQFSGTVNWNPAHSTFAASTGYSATITLSAKTGYSLTGVVTNFFTVAGAISVTNAANPVTVTALFPPTAAVVSPNVGSLMSVPAGRFQRDETHTNISLVTQPFLMSQHEITRAQFLVIMGTDPSDPAYSSGINDPVIYANWYHAIAFCNKLSLGEGLAPVYSVSGITDWAALTYNAIPNGSINTTWNAATADWNANGYRLPTEMEWMWAAMGAPADGQNGGTNTTGYVKAFAGSTGSNSIGNYAVFGYNSSQPGATTTQRSNPVGSRNANELGLYDMSGNVWEWCWDWYAYNGTPPNYEVTGTQTDYRGAASGPKRVMRGGGWTAYASGCTIAVRASFDPYSDTGGVVGFRVVRP